MVIGLGWWWADAVAAILIALDVLHDGFRHTGPAIRDLSDEMPRTVEDKELDPLIEEVKRHVDGLPLGTRKPPAPVRGGAVSERNDLRRPT